MSPQAALKLANTMLSRRVQEMFAQSLLAPSSEKFFTKLQLLFAESKDLIKEQKRKQKLLDVEAIWRHSAIDSKIKLEKRQAEREEGSITGGVGGGGGKRRRSGPSNKLSELQRKKLELEKEMMSSSAALAEGGQMHMLEVLKMMRRLCRHSCDPLQVRSRENQYE